MAKCPPAECDWPDCNCPESMWPGGEPVATAPQTAVQPPVQAGRIDPRFQQFKRPMVIRGAGLNPRPKTVMFDGEGEGCGTGTVRPGGMKMK